VLPLIRLPRAFEANLAAFVFPPSQTREGCETNFARPPGESALVAADSVSWRVFKNPMALLIGGVAAVILELAEPAVRTAIWRQSTFRADPMGRLRRTGSAAMVTIYGARSIAEAMIARVVSMHSKVRGYTPSGEAFSANDVELLTWVHATATFSFAQAYSRYVRPLARSELDAICTEALPASMLYGAVGAPKTYAGIELLFDSMRHRIEPSDVIFEFMRIVRSMPGFPQHLKWMQELAVRAAVEIVPGRMRERLGLKACHGLGRLDRPLVHLAASVADKIMLPASPAAQSCRRLGLPSTFLYT